MNLRFAWRLWGAYDQVRAAIRRSREEGTMDGKALVASKTMWVNLLGTLVQVLPGIAQYVPQPWGIITLGLLNLALRLVTKAPITKFLVE